MISAGWRAVLMVKLKVAWSLLAVLESASLAVRVTVWVLLRRPQIAQVSGPGQLPLPSVSRVKPAGRLVAVQESGPLPPETGSWNLV